MKKNSYKIFLQSGPKEIEIDYEKDETVMVKKYKDSNDFFILSAPKYKKISSLLEKNSENIPLYKYYEIHSPYQAINDNAWLKINRIEIV